MNRWRSAREFTVFHLNISLCRLILRAAVAAPLLRPYTSGRVICMQRVFQSSFLPAPSNQPLCIINLKGTGSVPAAARRCHTVDTATLAPSPLLWHRCPSVELKAASRPSNTL